MQEESIKLLSIDKEQPYHKLQTLPSLYVILSNLYYVAHDLVPRMLTECERMRQAPVPEMKRLYKLCIDTWTVCNIIISNYIRAVLMQCLVM